MTKIEEQLENLRLEFKEFKANLSVVVNVTEDVNQLKQDVEVLKEQISDIEDKISGRGHRVSMSVGYTLSVIVTLYR